MSALACSSVGGRSTPAVEAAAASDARPRDLQIGTGHACVVEAGGVACWGSSRWTDAMRIGLASVPGRLHALSVGEGQSCAITEAGEVWCWDDFNNGEAVRVPGLSDVVDVSVRLGGSCALHGDGRVSCWRSGGEAAPVKGVSGAVEVDCGQSRTCARLDDGGVVCWDGWSGRPRRLRAKDVVDIAVDWDVWILQANGRVRECFDRRCSRYAEGRVVDAVEIGTADSHVCVRRADGRVACWSYDRYLDVPIHPGWEREERGDVALDVPGVDDARALAVGSYHICVDEADDGPRCWGRNESFELGDAAGSEVLTSPTLVAGVADAAAVRVGDAHVCAVGRLGDLWCWGVRDAFSLEQDGYIDRDRLGPTWVRAGVERVWPGSVLTCAELGRGGALQCWARSLYDLTGERGAREVTVADSVRGDGVDLHRLWGCATERGSVRCFGAAGYRPLETVPWSNDVVWIRPRTWTVQEPGRADPVEVAV
ncbi:MAG: hypothetical protein KC486_24665, partial [Myxococcales bacterium]|nr:hypothetical protein [Myxococcales bacterium]